ncbi:MAG TPA: nitroreductase family protein [Chloroflexia bacterium]|nr:nitroreductase family protein [Chloroflexia bacterium]
MDPNENETERRLTAVLRGLRQVRKFRPDPVARSVIDSIMEVARWTGSGMNRQPWEFVLIQDKNTLGELSRVDGPGSHLAGAAFAVIVIMAGESPEIETYDEGRLTERLMLAGAANGLGAGIWWFKDGGAGAKRLLGIPAERRVRTAVAFGYPVASPTSGGNANGGRRPLSELVHEERY